MACGAGGFGGRLFSGLRCAGHVSAFIGASHDYQDDQKRLGQPDENPILLAFGNAQNSFSGMGFTSLPLRDGPGSGILCKT